MFRSSGNFFPFVVSLRRRLNSSDSSPASIEFFFMSSSWSTPPCSSPFRFTASQAGASFSQGGRKLSGKSPSPLCTDLMIIVITCYYSSSIYHLFIPEYKLFVSHSLPAVVHQSKRKKERETLWSSLPLVFAIPLCCCGRWFFHPFPPTAAVRRRRHGRSPVARHTERQLHVEARSRELHRRAARPLGVSHRPVRALSTQRQGKKKKKHRFWGFRVFFGR